tara:strand:+ start:108 stop:764 length:657 start_codon:yes stop_codon:yes gene_type:complete
MFTWRDKSGAPACVCQKALNPEGCQNVIRQLKDRTEPGTHITSTGSIDTEPQQRDSNIAWFTDQELQNIIRGYVDIANYECGWRYDIVDSEQLQFTVYDGDKKQHYDWHTDSQCDHHMARRSMQFHKPKENNLMYTPQTNLLGTVRKLSVSAILNDEYEGGELMFRFLDQNSNVKEVTISPELGDVVIFPSYLDHKVAPVTKGIRYSVVAWFGGPPFK